MTKKFKNNLFDSISILVFLFIFYFIISGCTKDYPVPEKTVYDLKIGESTFIRTPSGYNNFNVLKVPGGWIYCISSSSSIFVPEPNNTIVEKE